MSPFFCENKMAVEITAVNESMFRKKKMAVEITTVNEPVLRKNKMTMKKKMAEASEPIFRKK